jgi:alpha-mannosidase
VQIRDIRSTDLFAGTEQRPLQILRVTLANGGHRRARDGELVSVRADGPGVTTPVPVTVSLDQGADREVEIPVAVEPASATGTSRRVTVTAETSAGPLAHADGSLTVEAPGWTMFMVSHFHYDPVWWNTQAGYASTWDDLPEPAQARRQPGQEPAFRLVRAHMDAALDDADYKFVLAELDYLRPYWDACPQDRAILRQLIADGRVELVGGMYNEPNTNLTSPESTIRNVIYGVGYQRDVIGGDPRTGWMLDVFGHDPAYPAIMADAGLTSSSWARGPFHQWGPLLTTGSNDGMQFPSEFEWIAPDGRGLLTSYMANHYSAGWRFTSLPGLAEAEEEAYALFLELKKVALTPNVLLPVGADHVIPSRWATEIHRDWGKRYVWPRFVCGLPAEFFAAVRRDTARRQRPFPPQSRDMNPVYTGKDVSYIDTKQGQRAAETALVDGEKLATLMAMIGARFPAEAVDKAWRLLCFGAHHDAITGTESDQVYLDLLGGWREAWQLGTGVRDAAIGFLADHADTRGDGEALVVVNTLSSPRTDVATVTARFPESVATAGVDVRDDRGREVPAVITGASRHPDGTLAEVTLSFVAADVQATGYRTYRLAQTATGAPGWQPVPGYRAENDAFLVEADPERGGALVRILDKRAGRDLLRTGGAGNELVCHDEYPDHPDFREGPWHLVPNGTRRGTSLTHGTVRAEVSPAGQRLITTCQLGDLAITQEVTLWNGLDRLEFRTHVDGSIGHDRLLRVRFPLDIPGARPVYEVGNAVIGRTFGFPDVDAAVHPWTLDNPAYRWTGLSAAVRIALGGPDGNRARHAVGVAEVVADDDAPGLRDLVAALAQQGVTATTSRPAGPRYGSLHLDSNLPDVRVSIGGPEDNAFTARVLTAAGGAYAAMLAEQLAATGSALVWVPAAGTRAATWVPGADLRGERDLPILIVAGRDRSATAAAVADLVTDLADSTIEVTQPAGHQDAAEPLTDYSAAILNRGTPGAVVEPDGTLHLSLMRSCSGWPSGIWMDPPRRTAPDGSSFAWQHWSHTFEYALVCGTGDWRDAGFVHAGLAYNHELRARQSGAHDGELPPSASLLEVQPADVVLTALKPRGNPLASGRTASHDAGITLRCYESAGRAATARVRCFVPLRDGVVANVLEQEVSGLPATADGTLRLGLGPAATVTVSAMPDAREPGSVAAAPPDLLGPLREAAQPVFARYWLHNKGPAPLGHQPVSVHVQPRTADLAGPVSLRVTVSAPGETRGTAEVIAPLCVTVAPSGDLRYETGPDGYQDLSLLLEPRDDVPPGTYHVAVRVADENGQVVEDVITLSAGHDGESGEVPVEARLDPPELRVRPGDAAVLRVRLASRSRDEVRGEAQLISPFGTWELAGPWTRGFTIPAGGSAALDYEVRAPAAARPMTTWVLVKVMAFGTIHYTPPIPLTIG